MFVRQLLFEQSPFEEMFVEQLPFEELLAELLPLKVMCVEQFLFEHFRRNVGRKRR